MSDVVYLVSPQTKQLTPVRSVSLADIGMAERKDLEQWVIESPSILGEELLIITTKFSRFDRSSRRLDVLALDKQGKLVVVELKLDAERSLADLQALRYAAFCSNMTMEDVAAERAQFRECSDEEAGESIRDFLETEELPQLDSKPRIILAAGSMDDQELTACAMWLRTFGVDITCVELTPYRMTDTGQILLVPKVVVPLPEAKDYLVGVERKDALVSHRGADEARYLRFWERVTDEFNRFGLQFQAAKHSRKRYLRIGIKGTKGKRIHYEWTVSRRDSVIYIALHAESKDRNSNIAVVQAVAEHAGEIADGVDSQLEAGQWLNKRWAYARFTLPYQGDFPDLGVAPQAAALMKTFIERTWPHLEAYLKQQGQTP